MLEFEVTQTFSILMGKKAKPGSSMERISSIYRALCGSYQKSCAKNRVCLGITLFVLLWLVLYIIYATRSLFPEIDVALFSKCTNPLQNWDGKILNVPIWRSGFADRPSHFNLHNEDKTPTNIDLVDYKYNRPIVFWGTHHKTGTFLAKKLFARICAKMQWCCVFHVTRDSVHALTNSIVKEPVDALGHNHWIWHPRELNITNYYFIHLYRNPYKKVISGYKYHYDGTEVWTQKKGMFSICAAAERLSSSHGVARHQDVFEYCNGAYLCETCCRREHEVTEDPRGLSNHLSFQDKKFAPRSKLEYSFICDHLGHLNGSSLQNALHTLPIEKGLLVEAALDYYENLRMTTLVNQTAHDPRTLNVDLDYLTHDYNEAIWMILRHLKDIIPKATLLALHDDLKFFDLNASPLYRWSMNNPVVNHVTESKTIGGEQHLSSKQMMDILKNHATVKELYAPMLEMASKAAQQQRKSFLPLPRHY